MAKEHSYGLAPYLIINGYYHILMNKTSEDSFYNFFKGKIEKDETIEQCAQREFFEETGILVSTKHFEKYFFQKSPRKNIGIFLVDWTKYMNMLFDFQKKEIWSVSWVRLKEVNISKNQQKIAQKIITYFESKEEQLKRLFHNGDYKKMNEYKR